jgi:tetratricopeptide (TPR) repeat protein
MADAMLAEAVRLAPDDSSVIDLQFTLALQAGDIDKARAVYASALDRGVLNYNGLVYRARLESMDGKANESIATLTQAIELGADVAPVWRLLGSQQYESGLLPQATESFRKAYQIRPNEIANAKALVEVLRLSGKGDEALAVAREAERFGRSDAQFMNMWLRLESTIGGEAGRTRAMIVREQIAASNPNDRINKLELAGTYMEFASDTTARLTNETRAEYWSKSRAIIDELKAANNDLMVTSAEARWFADQGRVLMPDGTMMDGIERARGVYIEYIIGRGDEADAVPYIEMARFMAMRGRYGIAQQALMDAREHQSSQLEADKVLSMLMIEQGQYAAAEPVLRGVVDAGADDAQQSYRIQWIEMMLRTGDYAGASEQLSKLDAKMSETLTVLLQRAEVADGLGRSQEASDLLNRAVAIFPTSALAYTRRASFRMRDPALFEDVLIDLQQALTLEPTNTQTLQLRAGVYGSVGRYEDMLRDMVAAVRVNPNLTDILQAVMIEHILAGQEGRAMDIAEETLAARPRDLNLLARVARVFDERALWARSAEMYRRGWELSGDSGFGLAYINALISQTPPRATDADRVLRQVRALGEQTSTDWQVSFADAAIKMKRGQKNDGEAGLTATFEQIKSSNDLIARWWRNVRGLYAEDTASLRAYLNRLLAGEPAEAESTNWLKFFLGQVLVQTESYERDGMALLTELQNQGADSFFARLAYRQSGSVLYTAGKYEEALVVWTKGLDLFPGDWEMCNNCAFTLATKLDRPHDALPFAKAAVDASPTQPEVYDTLARAYVKLNQFAEAQEALTAATKLIGNKRSEVSLLLTKAELDLKNGEPIRAKRSLERLKLSISTLPDLREDFTPEIDEMLRKINSLGG